jgi:hypothetical protein
VKVNGEGGDGIERYLLGGEIESALNELVSAATDANAQEECRIAAGLSAEAYRAFQDAGNAQLQLNGGFKLSG